MSAIVVSVDTPYFAVSDRAGRVAVPNVPDERSSAEDLKNLDHVVTISESTRSLETLQFIDTGDFKLTHKNKYGQDYTPQASPTYKRP